MPNKPKTKSTGLPGQRALREAKGWSQQKLADEAEVSLRNIARIEAGETDPSVHKAARIAKALGKTIEELL